MFNFRPLSDADLPLVREWVARPHVAQWWDGEIDIYEDGTLQYIASIGDRPVAYVQLYVAGEQSRGVDQFIGDAGDVGCGLGTQMVREFCALVFDDPRITRIQVDPAPHNARAIRCYEKAGFRRDRIVTGPDGPALMMFLARG